MRVPRTTHAPDTTSGWLSTSGHLLQSVIASPVARSVVLKSLAGPPPHATSGPGLLARRHQGGTRILSTPADHGRAWLRGRRRSVCLGPLDGCRAARASAAGKLLS